MVRWEMRTRLFLRTTEFLWQEGHTAHASQQEAEDEARLILDLYADFAIKEAAIPVIPGMKSENEKFAGAVWSSTIEAMMGDKKALQAGTSHYLGQNFAKAFGTQFLNKNNELEYVYQTSWGVSTRMVGAVIMVHGDDKGLVLPPRLAPIQVVIVPIWRKEAERQEVLPAARKASQALSSAGVRVKLDDRSELSPGFKFNDWEMRGVPVRIEIGPRDVRNDTVVLARRDRPGREGKRSVSMGEMVGAVQQLLVDVQQALLDRATRFRDENIHEVRNYDEFKEVIEAGGFVRAPWAGTSEDELRVKEETKATIRCFPFETEGEGGTCFYTGRKASRIAIFGKAY